MTGASPLLLPTAIPADWTARLISVSDNSFDVSYQNPTGTKHIGITIGEPGPGMARPPLQAPPHFRGDGNSQYRTAGSPTDRSMIRDLFWHEPGTWTGSGASTGVPYDFESLGLDDAEFWVIANSLRQV